MMEIGIFGVLGITIVDTLKFVDKTEHSAVS